MFDTNYWNGLLDWIRGTMLEKYKAVSPEDLKLFHVTDDADDAVDYIVRQMKKAGKASQVLKRRSTELYEPDDFVPGNDEEG